ncbi:MAG: asparagine synthase (glutamine-hydrolyzing) [Zoogloeaceae bacterium]|nr:asparagine synthase (glutamine-hydrolyzing) [Rhodocyclaceae bacterium]MCP5237938.1 asparagine synthase (glutamine-hydrolyzing) [Zoogloeaceae bacterium]
MCGIAFLYDSELADGDARRRLDACMAAMWHRGPDAGGLSRSGAAWLGHRRLSIIDLGGSRQPMQDPDSRFTLSYNGEIYNYREVRQSLAQRWTFRTDGDTEVLLAGLVVEGIDFLSRLEGMWAFCLWDAEQRRALLCRDRMGKKPLFYHCRGPGLLAAASELPALRELVASGLTEDLDSTADILRYGHPLPGHTAWQQIKEVLPGHYLTWRPGEAAVEQPWWRLEPFRYGGTERDAARELETTLIEAVRRRMVADVEVGAFLSGGVDSSLICAIIRRHLELPLKTFTIGFDDLSFDEREYSRRIAHALDTRHFEQCLSLGNAPELERLLHAHVGQPLADPSLLPTALVSSVAAEQVKVALSGDGGDELFCGYQRYQARTVLRWYSRLPSGLRRLAEAAVRALPEPTAHHSRSLLKKAHLFLDVVGRERPDRPYVAPELLDPAQFEALAPALAGRGHLPPGIPAETEPDDIARMMAADALVYLPQDILVKVDRASMAHSLETRAPFLDSRLITLAFSLPRHWHRRGLAGKRMLRSAFGELLPPWIWQRRKQGFGVPVHAWFRGPLGDRLQDLAESDPDGPVDARALVRLLDEHRSQRQDHGLRLWALYAYLSWRGQRI